VLNLPSIEEEDQVEHDRVGEEALGRMLLESPLGQGHVDHYPRIHGIDHQVYLIDLHLVDESLWYLSHPYHLFDRHVAVVGASLACGAKGLELQVDLEDCWIVQAENLE
jgi:hypothetical protein